MSGIAQKAARRFLHDVADGLASSGEWAADHAWLVAALTIAAGLLLAEALR